MVMSVFNALHCILFHTCKTGYFLGVNFWSRIFGVLMFAPIRSSLSLDIWSTPPRGLQLISGLFVLQALGNLMSRRQTEVQEHR